MKNKFSINSLNIFCLLLICASQVGFFDLHEIAQKYKLSAPKLSSVLMKTNGTRTHFSPYGIKTDLNLEEVIKIMRSL